MSSATPPLNIANTIIPVAAQYAIAFALDFMVVFLQ